ncbi:hypothetical protein LguiA_012973 [Lonicera macranthoides]
MKSFLKGKCIEETNGKLLLAERYRGNGVSVRPLQNGKLLSCRLAQKRAIPVDDFNTEKLRMVVKETGIALDSGPDQYSSFRTKADTTCKESSGLDSGSKYSSLISPTCANDTHNLRKWKVKTMIIELSFWTKVLRLANVILQQNSIRGLYMNSNRNIKFVMRMTKDLLKKMRKKSNSHSSLVKTGPKVGSSLNSVRSIALRQNVVFGEFLGTICYNLRKLYSRKL